MTRLKISFDVDGVLAEGSYTPPDQRTNAIYARKSPVSPDVLPSVHMLSMLYDIYIISTRGHENANLGLRGWLYWTLGINLDTIAGVITYPNPIGPDGDPDTPMDKNAVVRALGISCHFDDDPGHVIACGDHGVLVVSDHPGSQEYAGRLPTVRTWAEIREFLTTPGLTLHGSDGVSIVSPARAEDVGTLTSDMEKAILLT